MNDLMKLLDGSVPEVEAGIQRLSHDDLLKLKVAETDGKTRKGVLDALDAALAAADAKRAAGVVQDTPNGDADATSTALTASGTAGIGIAADLDTSAPADLAPATEIDTSGAPQQIVPDVDLSHPAVDADPRAGTTEIQNRIDFNDPRKSGVDVVTEALASPKGE